MLKKPNQLREGIIWRSCVILINRSGAILVTLLLAKILIPEDFGLVAVASVLTNSLDMVMTIGLPTALICQTKNLEEDLPTVFTYLLVASSVLYVFAFFMAPVFARLMGDERFIAIVRVASLTLIFNSFSLPHYVTSAKRMNFKLNALPEIIGKFSYLILAPILAFNHFAYWSIIIATIVNSLTRYLAYAYFIRVPLHLDWNQKVLKGLLSFSVFIAVNSILMFCLESFDEVFIAKIISLSAAGYYFFAMRINQFPWQFISNVTFSVLLPHLAQKDSFNAKKRSFLNVNQSISMITFAAYGYLVLLVPHAIRLYGQKWLPVIPIFYALAAYAVIKTLFGRISTYVYATSRPQLFTFAILFFSCFVYPTLWIWKDYVSAFYVAVIYAAGMMLSFLMVTIYFFAQKEFTLREYTAPIVVNFLIAASALASAVLISQLTQGFQARWLQIALSLIVYTVCLLLGWRLFLWKDIEFLLKRLDLYKTLSKFLNFSFGRPKAEVMNV